MPRDTESADAGRRAAACVKACEGIPTKALEAGTVAEFLTHVQVMLVFLRNEVPNPPAFQIEAAEQMLRELGRSA